MYLRESSERVSKSQHSTQLIRSPVDHVAMKIIPGSSEPVKSEYSDLLKALDDLPDYQPVFLNDYGPEDRFDRRKWFNDLQLSCCIRTLMGIIWGQ